MRIAFFLLVFVSSLSVGISQDKSGKITKEGLVKLSEMEDSLSVFAYGVVNDTFEERRFLACKELILGLKKALKVENSFKYPFKKIRTISIQYPADSSFRIFTWQLYVNKDDYRYFGAIQMNQKELNLIPLIDRSFQVADLNNEVLNPESWYGALYYNIKECKVGKNSYYLLFGFDGFQFFRKRKVVDVLHFENGQAKFGKNVFVKTEPNGFERSYNRLFIEYSSEASTRLNYDELLEMIIFDHMIQMKGPHGEGVVNYPDGSYEAYEYSKDGKWNYIPKVFDQVSDEPPRPFPILDKKNGSGKPDLFGQTKKKN